MPAPRVIHTAAFRLALIYAALFALGAAVLVLFFDVAVTHYAEQGLQDDVTAELRVLLDSARPADAQTLARLVGEREHVLGSNAFLYLVTGPAGRRLAGDLPDRAARTGWSEVELPAPADTREYEDETASARSLGVALPSGGVLVVGRSTYGVHELRESLVEASFAAAGLITLMSLGVAFVIGRQFLSRIDRVSEAAARIMEGRLEERLPAIGMGDEFDRLAAHLNSMLERMQLLMQGLRQVSSDIAHDLRTPLMRLRRRLEEALAEPDGGDRRQALVAEALAQVDEILATFGALLRIAQVEGGTGREAFQPVDLSKLMERVREAYEPVAEDEGKALVAELAPDVVVSGDEGLLAQLISNLIENALTHAPAAERVTLRVDAEGGRAVLAVADEGPGVPETERAKVLERFYRLDRSRTTPGAGLGLSMVQAIARLHAGTVELADNQPGLIARVVIPRCRRP